MKFLEILFFANLYKIEGFVYEKKKTFLMKAKKCLPS